MMLRLLIPCLLWLSSVRSEEGVQLHSPDSASMDDTSITDSSIKTKRDSIHQPCPPVYSHGSYAPSFYVKPYIPPVYASKGVSVQHSSHVQYVHQPVAYVKPQPVVVKSVVSHPQVVVKPVSYAPVHRPMVSYAPVYQKPVYYAQAYQKPIYYAQSYQKPAVYVKKYEVPITQAYYPKSEPIQYQPLHYQPPRVIQVQPQVSYVKSLHAMVHPPVYLPKYVSSIKPYCP